MKGTVEYMGGISVLYRVCPYVGNRAPSFFRRWRLIRSLPIPRTNFKLSPPPPPSESFLDSDTHRLPLSSFGGGRGGRGRGPPSSLTQQKAGKEACGIVVLSVPFTSLFVHIIKYKRVQQCLACRKDSHADGAYMSKGKNFFPFLSLTYVASASDVWHVRT